MRLVINGRFLLQNVTGVQAVAINFANALDELLEEGAYPRLNVELVVPGRGEFVTQPNFRTIQLRHAGKLTGHLWEQLELPVLAGRSPLLCLGNLAPIVRLMTSRAATYTMIHDLSYKYFPDAYSPSFRALYHAIVPIVLSRSRLVITVSNSESRAILDNYPHRIESTRLLDVQNGGGDGSGARCVVDDPISLKNGSANVSSRTLRSPTCLYVGSLTRRKNAEGLLRAAIELTRTGDLEFVFVGSSGSSFETVGVDVPTDVARRITFLGQVNDPKRIESEYRRAAVFVFPSFYEASPLPPIEAMSFGCPVVCSDIPSLRERCGDAANYCDPSDVNSIVNQVRRVAEDSNLWGDLQRRGLLQAATYSWRNQVVKVLEEIGVEA